MFYFLSKAIDFLIMPLSIIFLLMLYGLVTKNNKTRRLMLLLTCVSMLLLSNTWLVNKVFNWWEPQPVNISSLNGTYDVGILLSGGLIGANVPSEDHAVLGSHGDRVLQTFLLYKAGKIKKVLITGTSSKPMMEAGQGETRRAAALMVKWGVPAQDIIFEENARNTRENALFSAKILSQKFPGGRYLLITSAYHMPRSAGCFAKVRVKTDQFPADYYGSYYPVAFKNALVPDPDALAYFSFLWHEWVGYIMYKLVGYS
jgi:uncharacterized SAM-binding protein YcdF (DUF218 family)